MPSRAKRAATYHAHRRLRQDMVDDRPLSGCEPESDCAAGTLIRSRAESGNEIRGPAVPRLRSLLSFAMHPRLSANSFMHEKFELPQLKDHVKEGSNISVSVGDYFSTMLDQSMNWKNQRRTV
jgi:hypothetical protein